jgi:zinc transport system substrate-binding protein
MAQGGREFAMHLPKAMTIGSVVILLLAGPVSCSLKAVCSIHPVAAIVREIGGDRVQVTTIVPTGSDPHHFELTPHKAKAIYDADVIFLIGGHFDRWVLPGGGRDLKDCTIVDFHEEFSESLMSMGRTFNPHFWLDPLFALRMAEIAGSTMCSLDHTNCSFYRAGIADFRTEIDSISASVSKRLSEAGLEDFVGFHPAWSYFARRYGLHEHGTLEISHEHEPSAKHIAEIVEDMISHRIDVILAEEFSNLDLARAVASQTGARIIYLDPLGGEDLPDRDTYGELLDYNISAIEKSLREE